MVKCILIVFSNSVWYCAGYELSTDRLTCEDINECMTDNVDYQHECDLISTECVNQQGLALFIFNVKH